MKDAAPKEEVVSQTLELGFEGVGNKFG